MLIRKLNTVLSLSHIVGARSVLRWKLLPKNTIFTVRIRGVDVKVRARTSDLPLAIECLTSEYESIAPLFSPAFEGVIIDAGGHIGCAAIRLSELFPKARIVCIEPSSDNLRILRMNTKHVSSVEIREAALVAKAAGRLTLSDRGRGGSGYTIVDNSQDTRSMAPIEDVDSIAITDLLEEFGSEIGFIKLDIEGAERDILALGEFRAANVPAIFVELHERISHGCVEAFESFSATRWTLRLGPEKYLSLSRPEKSMPATDRDRPLRIDLLR